MKKCLNVTLPENKSHTYPIYIGNEILDKIDEWLPAQANIAIITDHIVKRRYGNKLLSILKKKNYRCRLLSFPAGEKSKSAETKNKIDEALLKHHYTRDSLIIALGGGVVGDTAGFVAATYMRGIPYIQIPTTLLAMVDSSVGGKTSINTPQGKNLIGAFWQPNLVLSDIHCLTTLPSKQFNNGLIEALKIFMTSDKASFDFALRHFDKILARDNKTLIDLIYRAVKIKSHVVQCDERDKNLRMILNFGHTIGHALESITDYQLIHGYAVGYGILLETKIAELLGLLSEKHFTIIKNVLARLNIKPTHLKQYSINQLIKATKIDKKRRNQETHFVLLTQIGKVHQKNQLVAHPVPDKIVKQAYLNLTES